MAHWLRNTLLILAACYFGTVYCFSFLFSLSEFEGEDSVIQPPGDVTATEGGQVTLDCQFDAVNTNNLYLFWYKHELHGFPKFMLGLFSFRSTNATGYEERFYSHLDKDSKSVPLTIQRAQLSDSAVYYCALKPTVTGNPETLHKNLTSPERVFKLCSSRFYLTIVPSSGVNMPPLYYVKRRSLVLDITCNEWN
uniref:Ig-like domain-containing protein n=1 Tax=Oncorhynchus tshawytscha TaxID=74940 RepID=A0A8C8J4U7_ONCTS